jgi:hypothetical protein
MSMFNLPVQRTPATASHRDVALPPATPASAVRDRDGRPAQVVGQGIGARFFDDRLGVTVTVKIPLYKDDNFNLGGYFTIDRHGRRHDIAGWSPAAAERHGRDLAARLLSRVAIDPRQVVVHRTHERVLGGDGGQHWVPTARRTQQDGQATFWAFEAARIPTGSVPRGASPEFARGFAHARRVARLATGLAVLEQALTVAGLGAKPVRLGTGYRIAEGRGGADPIAGGSVRHETRAPVARRPPSNAPPRASPPDGTMIRRVNPRNPTEISIASGRMHAGAKLSAAQVDEIAAFVVGRHEVKPSHRAVSDALRKADRVYVLRDDRGAILGTAALKRNAPDQWFLGQVAGRLGGGTDVMKWMLADVRSMAVREAREMVVKSYTFAPENVYDPREPSRPGFYRRLQAEIVDPLRAGPSDMTTQRIFSLQWRISPHAGPPAPTSAR